MSIKAFIWVKTWIKTNKKILYITPYCVYSTKIDEDFYGCFRTAQQIRSSSPIRNATQGRRLTWFGGNKQNQTYIDILHLDQMAFVQIQAYSARSQKNRLLSHCRLCTLPFWILASQDQSLCQDLAFSHLKIQHFNKINQKIPNTQHCKPRFLFFK